MSIGPVAEEELAVEVRFARHVEICDGKPLKAGPHEMRGCGIIIGKGEA